MKILDRLPIPTEDSLVFVGSESVLLKKHEIIVWLSLTYEKSVEWNPAAIRFPAILDTGHTHNFAIQHQHLIRWVGIQPEQMRRLGHIRHAGVRMPLVAANVWMHQNESGKEDDRQKPVSLAALAGIAVYPDMANYPRLPLLGLRAILSNQLHLTVDGKHASVTLITPDWRTRAISWLV